MCLCLWLCVCVCACACARARVRACVCVFLRVRARMCVISMSIKESDVTAMVTIQILKIYTVRSPAVLRRLTERTNERRIQGTNVNLSDRLVWHPSQSLTSSTVILCRASTTTLTPPSSQRPFHSLYTPTGERRLRHLNPHSVPFDFYSGVRSCKANSGYCRTGILWRLQRVLLRL